MKPLMVSPTIARRCSSIATTNATARDLEILGLFLHSVIPADKSPNVVDAVEGMAQDAVAPSPSVANVLLLHTDTLATQLVDHYTPTQLCVLLDTLQSLATRPISGLDRVVEATIDVASTCPYTRLGTALRAVVALREDLQLAIHGDAATLRPSVESQLRTAHHHQRAARLLLTATATLPHSCIAPLQEMAVSGRCLGPKVVQELWTPDAQTALTTTLERLGNVTVHDLLLEFSRAATADLGSNVLSFWAALHTAATAGNVTFQLTISDVVATGEQETVHHHQLADFYTSQSHETQRIVQALERHTTAQRFEAKANGDGWWRRDPEEIEAAYDRVARGESVTPRPVSWYKRMLPSLSKLEILRDFAQVTSLVFTNLYTVALAQAPETMSRVQQELYIIQAYLRGLANFFAADFTAVLLRFSGPKLEMIPDILFAGLLLAVIAGCAGLGFLAWIVFLRWTPHESPSTTKTKWYRPTLSIRSITWILTFCQSVHLPVARLSMEILTGTQETSSVYRRYHHEWFWPHLHIGAIVLLVIYVGGLIVLLGVVIHFNAPRVTARARKPTTTWRETLHQYWTRATTSHHLEIIDLDGTTVDFHNSVYATILTRDASQRHCPYRSLYAGFERRWRYYKVIQLTMKVVLTMLLIPIRDGRARAFATLGVTTLSFIATLSAPFIDDVDDKMEMGAKLTAVVTCIGGVVLAYDPQADNHGTRFIAGIVNAVNILNAIFMVGITAIGSDKSKRRLKAWRGRFTFSDSSRYATDQLAPKVLGKWHVDHELRHRVWHAFWKRTLLALGEYPAIQRLAHAKREEERAAEAAMKHKRGNQAEAADLAFRRHWLGQSDEHIAAVRLLVQSVLQGPDVWYEATGTTKGWGCLKVVPYPFHCTFHFDDMTANPITIVDDSAVGSLLFINFHPDVVRRRRVRQQLRALSVWKRPIDLQFERDEQWTESEPFTTFHVLYSHGIVCVQQDDATGFRLAITFQDGHGQVVDPETHEVVHCAIGRSAVIEGDDALALLGLTPAFDESNRLYEICESPKVSHALVELMPQLHAIEHDGRERQLQQQYERDAVLGRGFRFIVYNNPHLTRRDLERYLKEDETNTTIQRVVATRRAALDVLYEKLRYLYTDRRVAFWFIFWHDVFEQNRYDLAAIERNQRALDPFEPTSIAYDVMPREALQRWLKQRGLWGERWLLGWCWRKTLFHQELLDLLYKCMENQTSGEVA